MTITRAKQITADLISRNYNTGNIDELGEYKDIVDAAKEWAQENYPLLYYKFILRYLQELENADNRICSTCKHWEPFTGACGGGDSPYCADFTDGDCTCADWEARLEK